MRSAVTGACVLCLLAVARAQDFGGLFGRALDKCAATGNVYACLAERAANAVERAQDWSIPLVDGISLVRNNRTASASDARGFASGFGKLSAAVSRFMESHTLVVDLGEQASEGDDDDVGEARGKEDKKKKKKEKKFASYALMVMMGIFGLTGPLILKTLALIAGKALIASKMALLIVGSVALKKLFEKDDKAPSVKVRTVEPKEGTAHDEHDRLYYAYNNNAYNDYYYNQNQTPYSAYNNYNNKQA